MKKLFTMMTLETEAEKLESLLNTYRVGLNDWDKSKVFDIQGYRLMVYTVVCEEDTFVAITQAMGGTRMY